jgi:16S rRNA (adenine1518-N6/adenine1519-N6)-dimethyltransferase
LAAAQSRFTSFPREAHPRLLLRARGLGARKRFGQNFLIDTGAISRIADLCMEPGLPIVEIGPGTGALTLELFQRGAGLTAIEIDAGLVHLLREQGGVPPDAIVEGDALTFDYDTFTGGRPWCAAGNLPYNIATPLILGWLELRNVPESMVVMVQRDVADRFAAHANSPAYGSLSVALQFAMTVRRAFVLGPRSFYPAPKVDSAVVVLERRTTPPVAVRDRVFFLKVVRGAFAYRRKTLANSLALALDIPRQRTHEALQTIGRAMEIRAEQLELADFAAISDAVAG